jgi:hypothetical protein
MSVAMSVSGHDDTAARPGHTRAAMIELRLSLDPTADPVSGHVTAAHGGEPTLFIGYVELISVLERVRAGLGAATAADRGGQEQ